MSTWSDLGLPNPEVSGYTYTVLLGLLRTSFETAHPLQTKNWVKQSNQITAEVVLNQHLLYIAENFIQDSGYQWFTMDLVSGQTDSQPFSQVSVRLMEPYQVSCEGYATYRMTMTLEVKSALLQV